MNEIEKKAWQEALKYAFKEADLNPWDSSQNYRDYAIEYNNKLYPNKIIYRYSLEYLKNNYKDLYRIEITKVSGVGEKLNFYLSQRGANAVLINNKSKIYWHIQMNQPWGRNQGKIDSTLMLEEENPVIGTGDWDDKQCRYFTGNDENGLKEGDIILVREGSRIIALCEIKSDSFVDELLESKYHQKHFRYVKVLDLYKGEDKFPQPQSTLQRLHNKNTESWKLINNYYKRIIKNQMTNKIIDLLKYKKQIILQGPPGTGKTRVAKKIANELIGDTGIQIRPKQIDSSIIRKFITKNLFIKTVAGDAKYKIIDVTSSHIHSEKNSGTIDKTSFKSIEKAYNDNIWEESSSNSPDRRARAFAKYIYDNYEQTLPNDNSEQLKLIQFHPSYTYEDFVRGIVSKPNEDGEGIVYEAKNKVLADFAKKALDNYLLSINQNKITQNKPVFDAFIDTIKEEIAQSELHKFNITDAVYLFSADETRFKYKGDNWVAHSKGLNMKFSELKKIIDSGATERQDIKKMSDLEELTRQHATYFIKLVEKYYEFENSYELEISNTKQVELKNYVLIIDEINRANLSSVLGELIYALEYRGETVESMYEVDGNNKLVLPPNLHIIGTMNTADRSVGHIDYAIRRRFAFVDVLPKDLSNEENILFDSELFFQVEKLFDTNLSPEFEKKDVQLGHSYFIDKSEDGGSLNIRLEYEIKPILIEYVKDGVLIGDNINKLIEDLESSL